MRKELFWVPTPAKGRLAILPRPRGGDWLEDEVRAWRSAGVDIVLSLLTPSEVSDFELPHEESICHAAGIDFLTFPILDREVPAKKETVLVLATELRKFLMNGKNVAIHCRQGIGRAALIAICVLILAGADSKTAIAQVSTARGLAVPETSDQKRWVMDFASDLSFLTSN